MRVAITGLILLANGAAFAQQEPNGSPSGNGASPPATVGSTIRTDVAPSGGKAGDLAQGHGEDGNDDLRQRTEDEAYKQSGVHNPTDKIK